jgi:NADH-quinone oxidoreductase subunit E
VLAEAPEPTVPRSPTAVEESRGSGAKPEPAAVVQPVQPKGIAAPRGGTSDELQQISGVGPKIELTLHKLGIFHFDQIAGWTHEEAQWVDDHLKFRGRIARDEWIKQAKQLASGSANERRRRQGNGSEKKPAKPKTAPGSRRR